MPAIVDKGKTLGQVFTPKWVADLIVYWAIRSKDDRVLDPAAGTGVFIEAALDRLHQLGSSNPGPQVVAIELDKKLAKYLSDKYEGLGVKVLTGDFFSYSPRYGLHVIHNGSVLSFFDAVVGNPPYIERQLMLNYKYLKNMFPDIPSLADIYVYFVIHGSTFLKSFGRLGFIISDSWLTANYGTYLKKFLLEKLKLKYVIYFDKRVFEKRLVSSTIILAEKRLTSTEDIIFIRVKNIDENVIEILKEIICKGIEKKFTDINDHLIITKVPAKHISAHEQWLPYVLGLKYYLRLKTHSLLVPLERIA